MAVLLRGMGTTGTALFFSFSKSSLFSSEKALIPNKLLLLQRARNHSVVRSGLDPPDVSSLAQTARISLSPQEVEEFAPKIQQVVDWFGQLQAVDLERIEPAIRADTEGGNLRDDVPEPFKNREAMIAAVPIYEDPFIKVPKVLNKEENS